MNDNVIRPATWARTINEQPIPGIGGQDDSRTKEREHRQREILKLEEITKRCGQKPLLRFPPTDKTIAARGLGLLIEQVRNEKGINVSMLRQKHGLEKIYRYALFKDVNPVDDSAEARSRTATVRPYLRYAEKIAEITKQESKDLQIRVLRGTSLWQNWGQTRKSVGGGRDFDERAVNLAILIQHLSDRVIRDTHLKSLFAEMRRESGQWDIVRKTFRPCPDFYGPFLYTAFQDNDADIWQEGSSLPSVPLIRVLHSVFQLPILIADEPLPVEGDAEARILKPLPPADVQEVEAKVHLYREIRLALGPTVNEETLGPLFESRAYGEFVIRMGIWKYAVRSKSPA